jgi:hypothetical protein
MIAAFASAIPIQEASFTIDKMMAPSTRSLISTATLLAVEYAFVNEPHGYSSVHMSMGVLLVQAV